MEQSQKAPQQVAQRPREIQVGPTLVELSYNAQGLSLQQAMERLCREQQGR